MSADEAMRSAQVLVTLTEEEGGDLRVALERVGGDGKSWAVHYVANLLADDDDTELEEVQLAGGVSIRSEPALGADTPATKEDANE